MLKKCYGLFLGLLVVTGSACVTPTHASSASIVITNIRVGSQTSAAEEAVVLYNNTSVAINVTHWCLTNKLAVKFACFTPSTLNTTMNIPGYGYISVVSNKNLPAGHQYPSIYEPSTSSSGSIVASSDSITLIDAMGEPVDQFSWTSSITSSQQWSRTKLSMPPDYFIDSDAAIDWQKGTFSSYPSGQFVLGEQPHSDIPSQPAENPDDGETVIDPPDDTGTGSTETPERPLLAIITELLPNAIGSDAGNEFIEIHNPNTHATINLKNYVLGIGPTLDKGITLEDYNLQPGEYVVFTNAQLSYSLLNTSSRVTLFAPNSDIASEVPMYTSPGEGKAWALINGVWQYTNTPTPESANVGNLEISTPNVTIASPTTLKPCAANQYRSVETNRCRLISSTVTSVPAPCKSNQERNTETGRCRNISVQAVITCKEGQERNAETNRCRNIKKLTTANYGIKKATEKSQGGVSWYMGAAIVGIVLLILGYGVYEWREELGKVLKTIKAKFAHRSD